MCCCSCHSYRLSESRALWGIPPLCPGSEREGSMNETDWQLHPVVVPYLDSLLSVFVIMILSVKIIWLFSGM